MNNIDFEQELYKHFGQVKDFTLGMRIGKYFYELGKQSGSSEIPNDLEEAAWDCVLDSVDVNNPVLLPKYKELLTYLFIAGAKWQKEQDDKVLSEKIAAAYQLGIAHQKEQMMKETVEGEVENASFGIVYLRKNLANDGYLTGDKVRVIVLPKEDEK